MPSISIQSSSKWVCPNFVKGAVHLAASLYRSDWLATPFDRLGSNSHQTFIFESYLQISSQKLKMLPRLATNLAQIWPIWPNIAKSLVFKIETWFSHQMHIFESYLQISSQNLKMLLRLARNLAWFGTIWPTLAKSIVFKIETWFSHQKYIFQSY